MKVKLLLLAFIFITSEKLFAQYKEPQHVQCLGGGKKTNGMWKNYSVVGEIAVDSYVNQTPIQSTIGFLNRQNSYIINNISNLNENPTNSFYIFPNPNSGVFSLGLDLNKFTSGLIVILDLRGKIIYQAAINSNNRDIEVTISNIARGIYFAQLNDGINIITKKIVIQ